ncbi:MAG: hypothetical protein QW723_06110 [Candidatus Bathyarchaeia archaeon]
MYEEKFKNEYERVSPWWLKHKWLRRINLRLGWLLNRTLNGLNQKFPIINLEK